MPALLLHDLPFEIVPLEARLLLCSTPAGFPSPAADDIEEPIDLGTWLIEQPAASYVMRVDGTSMSGAGINDGDLIVVSRAKKPRPGHIVVALVEGIAWEVRQATLRTNNTGTACKGITCGGR